MKRILVLISGNGSNLQTILDGCAGGKIAGEVVGVISNKADAYGLVRAKEAGVAAAILAQQQFASREEYDAALLAQMADYQPDLVVLAGFMRILSADLVRHFAGRMINIHPSLLPKYQGLHTHQRAIDAGDDEHGASVHFVTEELDGGPVILQARVPIFEGDDAGEVAARVQVQEHSIYPLVVQWFCEGRLQMRAGSALLDGMQLGPAGYASE
ncbi:MULTISPECIES: phosphoribosylglycinamide formyltransferase [Aeromonas]|uniref:phosphoribosylglycinamide formyltransferase n=1 Tax=Aeromonas TaxID=642 RepID=UPI001FF53560|nr:MULTISPECIES: phosphoribosylglycinamide formyltransferase [Aeromonas]MCK0185299.1 phosphoribosylglycinamide formyltransferase [Aeromonas hydrophila]UOV93577.1 phosphoribosylglycinamide formyltransferase [Aeromonas hydrophila]HEG4446413.1 phosphoribosylglycinamide formyltransferase [Aeromonas hydrophila]